VQGVLRRRLLPPQPPTPCIPRTALVGRIVDSLDDRLVTIIAGAGYGKTTVLRLAVDRLHRPWVWCSCDDRLDDGGLLLRHLAAGLGQRYPGFGARLTGSGTLRDQVDDFCEEVAETVPEDVVMILDDVHLLPPPAQDAVAALVDELPSAGHLAIAGRSPLPLPLARLRAGHLLELGEPDLALTLDESAGLLDAVGLRLGDREIARLHGDVEGWAAGLILSAQAGGAEGRPQIEYLAEEVLMRQPPDVQRFLLETSILDRFDPLLAEAVTRRPDAGEVIADLVGRHLFTVRLGDDAGSVRYHHLFQAFLRRRLEEEPADVVRELHRRAAAALLAAGENLDAVTHFLAAGDPVAGARALEPVAESLVTSPQAHSLLELLDAMPPAVWSDNPRLVTARAALLLIRGEHEASFEEFERAIEQLLALGDHERAAAALLRLLQSMITAGTRPARRIEAGERYIGRIDPGARALPAARILLASSYAYACEFTRADSEIDAALALPASASQPVLRVYADVVRAYYIRAQTGRIEEAVAALDEAIAELGRLEAEDELGFMPYASMFRVYLLNDLGRHADADAEIARTVDAAARRGMARTHRRVVAWIRSVAMAGLGRWDELGRDLAPPVRAPGQHEPTSYSYRYHAVAAALDAARGDAAAVAGHVATAREEMRAFGRAFDSPMVLCDLARAAEACGLGDLALDVARDARRIAEGNANPWGLGRALMHSATGPGSECDAALDAALELTDRWSFEALWTARERALAGPLLSRALIAGLGPPGLSARLAALCGSEVFRECVERAEHAHAAVRVELAEVAGGAANVEAAVVERLLRDRDPSVRAAARRSRARLDTRPRPAIRIVTLGRFAVTRDGVPVPESAFGRQASRALLGVLLAARAPVHRERLTEVLWPDLPPERASAALRVALHGLRHGIAPELEANAPGSPVLADGETIRLALDEHDEWDVTTFLSLAAVRGEDPDATIAALERAEDVYGGPFLPEWPYADWAAPARRELEARHLEVLERLAESLEAAGRLHEAIRRYRRLVALEPEREAWHRALMRCFAAAGERAQALRQFHACRTVLRREQGVGPGPETADLYRGILLAGDEP
jgi:ATP/maltotriose-dependent transcriptional regulator MalT/DNA-binding SARP family transcriptional activator